MELGPVMLESLTWPAVVLLLGWRVIPMIQHVSEHMCEHSTVLLNSVLSGGITITLVHRQHKGGEDAD